MRKLTPGLLASLAFLLIVSLGVGPVLAPVASAEPPPMPRERLFLSISSGPPGSAWYVVAGLVAEAIERTLPNARVTNTVGQPIRNTNRVDTKEADMGTEFGFLGVAAMNGDPPFEKPVTNVAAIGNIHSSYYQVFARADAGVKSLADLKDKRIAVGVAGTANDTLTQNLLALYGLTYDTIRANGGSISFSAYEDAKQLMADGHIDVITVSSTKPWTMAVELQLTHDIRIVPLDEDKVDEFLRRHPGFGKSVVAPNTYKHQPEAVWAIRNPGFITVRKDLPDDLVYWITKAWWDQYEAMIRAFPAIEGDFSPELAVEGLPIPQHPGARKYFQDIGVLPRD